jgi:membrane protein YqaA with SNARE-associated domain
LIKGWTLLLIGGWAYSLFRFFQRLGGIGLLLLGILDSSFLFLPFGNDLLLISLVSNNRNSSIWIFYVLMSSLGSLIGAAIVDALMRKAGEEGLEKFVKPEKIKRLRTKMEQKAGWTVFFATIIPPPFPFTAVVMTASALKCSRLKILLAVFFGRIVRFTIEALLALYLGYRLLQYLNSDIVEYAVYIFIAIAIIGSIFSVRKWISGSRKPKQSVPVESSLS